jgi:hypothetical protein
MTCITIAMRPAEFEKDAALAPKAIRGQGQRDIVFRGTTT